MQLKASKREPLGKRTRRLHREGKLAAVVYGHSAEATPLVLDRLEFQKVFVKSGRTHLVDLVVDGDRTEKVLVREIQTHPRRPGPIHVDFYQVSLEEKIRVEVPVHLTGESAAVKRGDADILQPIHALEVECLPTDIPGEFEVDLTPLVHEQTMLALPTRPLCRETCRGLCSRCGANLNAGPCDCQEVPADGRLAVLHALVRGK